MQTRTLRYLSALGLCAWGCSGSPGKSTSAVPAAAADPPPAATLASFQEPEFTGMAAKRVSYDFDRVFVATDPPASGDELAVAHEERRRLTDGYLQTIATGMAACGLDGAHRVRVRFYADAEGRVLSARVVAEPQQPPSARAAVDCVFALLRGQRVPQRRVLDGPTLVDVPGPLEVEVTLVVP